MPIRVLLLALPVIACSRDVSVVFVPGESFRQSIQISTEQGEQATVKVGQPLVLHASRTSGPWLAREQRSLPPDACWLASPPPEHEVEVADNLKWSVDQPGVATFNVGLRSERTREVRFSAPGVYQLTAESSAWCGEPYGGNAVTVSVVRE